ncbi:reverse transcriptase domain-containing protein [Tanacetum coccineum]|uniref:Reverse transcriptase domain-containing protein n=1 Tax=Tanacetum coccineum TaxID=301880 RepID=A0ABQ5J9Q1_9ASTR
MTALEKVKESVTDITTRHKHDSEEFYVCHQDAQDDRAIVRDLSRRPRTLDRLGLTSWSVFVGCRLRSEYCSSRVKDGDRLTRFRTVGHDADYGMPWKTLMKMITENYYPRSEIKKLETELWNLTVKGIDVKSYTQHFPELILMCSRMVPDESDKVEKYNRGLPNSIQGSVMASKPTKL